VRDGTVPDTRGSVQLLLDPTSSPRARAAAADAVRATLSFAVGQTADAQELFLIDLDGRIVVSTNNAHEGLDESAQDYVRNGGRPCSSPRSRLWTSPRAGRRWW
jgi:hypothetical protein